MNLLTLENPVFAAYVIAAALMVLKVMGQGWMTVYRMMRTSSGFASPEDAKKTLLNPNPTEGQTDVNDYVDRSRRMHHNDLENIPGFWVAGLLFVFVDPALWLAQLCFYGFVGARALHFWAYATKQIHDIRATFYTIGSLIVMYMAAHVLWVVVAG